MGKKFNKDIPTVFTDNGYHKVMLPNLEIIPHLMQTKVDCCVDCTFLEFKVLIGTKDTDVNLCRVNQYDNKTDLILPNGSVLSLMKIQTLLYAVNKRVDALVVSGLNANICTDIVEAVKGYKGSYIGLDFGLGESQNC